MQLAAFSMRRQRTTYINRCTEIRTETQTRPVGRVPREITTDQEQRWRRGVGIPLDGMVQYEWILGSFSSMEVLTKYQYLPKGPGHRLLSLALVAPSCERVSSFRSVSCRNLATTLTLGLGDLASCFVSDGLGQRIIHRFIIRHDGHHVPRLVTPCNHNLSRPT